MAQSPGEVRRIGIYAAYLHTLGGGENLLAVLAQCLERELPAATIDLITHGAPIGVDPVVERFGVDLRRTRVRLLPTPRRPLVRHLHPLPRLLHDREISRVSAEYDLFVNGTIFSVVPPRSPRSLYVCMFPLDPRPASAATLSGFRRLLKGPYLAARRRAILRYVGAYDRILSISEFTRGWVEELWQADSVVLYPPVHTASSFDLEGKEKRVLAIGRFFPGNHNKKHDVLIESFAGLCERRGLGDGWELHLAGGRTDVPGTDDYIARLRRLAEGLPVHVHVDADGALLRRLLERSSIFWHATGFGEDERQDPYKLEHFGISTVEAMSHGCVPVVYAAGGQPEIVEDGVSGFLWRDLDILAERTVRLARDHALRQRLARAAHLVSRRFGREAFAASVGALVADLFPAPAPAAASEVAPMAPAGEVGNR